MNRETAKELLPVITAYANGEIIQYRTTGDTWVDMADPSFSPGNIYRIKPKPVTRPWTRDEVPVGSVMTEKCSGDRWLITAAVEDGLRISGGVTSSKLPFSEALERWTINGSPCGVAE